MSGINQLTSIGTEDPEYYAELLRENPGLTSWHLPSDGPSCLDVPGIWNVYDPLTQRLQILLDVVADISLCQRGNISATMACLMPDKGSIEMQLYIVFNHKGDGAARSCPQNLELIFGMLRRVPYQPPAMDHGWLPKGHHGGLREQPDRSRQSHPQLLIQHLCTSR